MPESLNSELGFLSSHHHSSPPNLSAVALFPMSWLVLAIVSGFSPSGPGSTALKSTCCIPLSGSEEIKILSTLCFCAILIFS